MFFPYWLLNRQELIKISNICLYHLPYFCLHLYSLVAISVYSPINGGIVYSHKNWIPNKMKTTVSFAHWIKNVHFPFIFIWVSYPSGPLPEIGDWDEKQWLPVVPEHRAHVTGTSSNLLNWIAKNGKQSSMIPLCYKCLWLEMYWFESLHVTL